MKRELYAVALDWVANRMMCGHFPGFEKTDLDPAYVRCASNLARLVVLLERSPEEIPSAFRHDFQYGSHLINSSFLWQIRYRLT